MKRAIVYVITEKPMLLFFGALVLIFNFTGYRG